MVTIVGLPDISDWEMIEFEPIVPKRLNRSIGRRTEGVIYGTPYWTATYRPVFLLPRDIGKMDSFKMKVGDGAVFKAHDTFRPRPMAHDGDSRAPLSGTRAVGGSFDGTATLQEITDSRTVVISGLPASFQFTDGDYINFVESEEVVSLHRIVSDVQANGSGVATLPIKYGLDTEHFTTAATVNLEKPYCLMQIDAGTWEGKKSLSDRRPTFSATEVFFYQPAE